MALEMSAAVTVPGLLDALKDEDAEVRRGAAQAIGELGPQAGMTAPADAGWLPRSVAAIRPGTGVTPDRD